MEYTFKQYMKEKYTLEELQDIAAHGCESGCAGTLIYYSDTNAIYDRFAEEIHTIIADEVENFGEVPEYLKNALAEPIHVFKNNLVWFVAETYAFELSNQTEEV